MPEEPDDQLQSTPLVIVSVRGGVPDLVLKSEGIAVLIVDYDVEGEEHLDKDAAGADCRIGEWPASARVAHNEHWRIIKHAGRCIVESGTRKWQCPRCGRVLDHSYDDLAHVGIAICSCSDIEMERID